MPRVLVVDDSYVARSTYARALEELGCDVETATDGDDAYARFVAGAFDAILTDLEMPSVDGVELLRRVRERSDVPVILLSSLPPDAVMARCGVLAPTAVAHKEIDRGSLGVIVRAAIVGAAFRR